MSASRVRLPQLGLIVLAIGVVTLSLVAQTPAPGEGPPGTQTAPPDGQQAPPAGPALASSPRVLGHENYIIKTLLHGLTGPPTAETTRR